MLAECKDIAFRESLATFYAPKIYQEFNSVFDLITPISLQKVEEVIKDFAKIASRPVLYFGAKEDSTYYYLYYMVYHPFDISQSSIKLIRKWDSHRHDTEGVLIRANKVTNKRDAITVSHCEFLTQKGFDGRLVIEANGHGIRPYNETGPSGNYVVYENYEFEDLGQYPKSKWELLRSNFGGGVKMPDEQHDTGIGNIRNNRRGDIWNRPDVLFKNLKLKGRF